MICAYCKRDGAVTKEHIISASVLELFPECDLTYDAYRKSHYKSEPVIKDVCKECNNEKLSYIDDYAKNMISKYFNDTYKPDTILRFEYQYSKLLKILMKYAYNDLRSHKDDCSMFDQNTINFLLNEEQLTIDRPVSIFGGLHINMSPIPDFIFGNQKLQWTKSPTFFCYPLIEIRNRDSTLSNENSRLFVLEIKGVVLSYFFKFNSGLFILFIWENIDVKETYEQGLPLAYPYTLLRPECDFENLSRCTHAYNCHTPQLIDLIVGIDLADSTNGFLEADRNPYDVQLELNAPWKAHEDSIKKAKKK